jgi:hypothetical protein
MSDMSENTTVIAEVPSWLIDLELRSFELHKLQVERTLIDRLISEKQDQLSAIHKREREWREAMQMKAREQIAMRGPSP